MTLDRGMLAKIHIAKKELGWSDDIYRDILQTRYKVDSAAKLNRFQGDDLIRHFKGLGFKIRKKNANGSPFKPSATYESAMARKVVAIWVTLGLAGKVRARSDWALQSYVKRMTGRDNLAWCDDQQLWKLIESLKKWAKREGVELEQ